MRHTAERDRLASTLKDHIEAALVYTAALVALLTNAPWWLFAPCVAGAWGRAAWTSRAHDRATRAAATALTHRQRLDDECAVPEPFRQHLANMQAELDSMERWPL